MIEQGIRLFDHLVIAVGHNPTKKFTFDIGQRKFAIICVIFEELHNQVKSGFKFTFPGYKIPYCSFDEFKKCRNFMEWELKDEKITIELNNCLVDVSLFDNKFLVKYADEIKANYILRGIRNPHDYEYEKTMRNINEDINKNIQTVFLMPPRNIAEVSSSMVRGLIGPSGWEKIIEKYVPKFVLTDLKKRFQNQAIPPEGYELGN